MGNCSSVTAPPINETEILPYLEAHLERGSKPPRHAANGVSEVPPQPLQEPTDRAAEWTNLPDDLLRKILEMVIDSRTLGRAAQLSKRWRVLAAAVEMELDLTRWHVKERGASRLPFGHKHFLAGIFKPQEADDPDPHPHGEWRWLTGMPDGALRLKMAEELGSRIIEMRGNRHCLLRKYFHALKCEEEEQGETNEEVRRFLEEARRDSLPHCFQCAIPCRPTPEGTGTQDADGDHTAKQCERHPRCGFALCMSCHRYNMSADSYGYGEPGPASFRSYCYFCTGRTKNMCADGDEWG